MRSNHIRRLRESLIQGNLIPFIGAGVSKAVADLPSWNELLQACISREAVQGSDKLSEIINLQKSKRYPECFRICKEVLDCDKEDSWDAFLVEIFSRLDVETAEPNTNPLIRALRQVNARIAITTNYDTLIRDFVYGETCPALTWNNSSQMLSKIRLGQAVIHLHGRHDDPSTIIITNEDYTRVKNTSDQRAVVSSIFYGGVLVFIGCSIEGVTDENIGSLLGQFSELSKSINPDETVPHYLLCMGEPSAQDIVKLKRFGVVPVSYGNKYEDLPKFLCELASDVGPAIHPKNITSAIQKISPLHDIQAGMNAIHEFIRDCIFEGQVVRVSFAEKIEQKNAAGSHIKYCLENRYIVPGNATHNLFSYPETMAAWALIEGKIFVYPNDLEKQCDFEHLKQIKKEEVIVNLLKYDETQNPVEQTVKDYLNPEEIRYKSATEQLTIKDIYQHWVGRQKTPHYKTFISVPVPLIDKYSNEGCYNEYGVFNIDTNDSSIDFSTAHVQELLRLASELTRYLFESRINQ